MVKYDFKKEKKNLYYPSERKVAVVDVPRMNFLMIDGKGIQTHLKSIKMRWKHCFLYPTKPSLYPRKKITWITL